MLRWRFLPLLQNESSLLSSCLSRNLHISQNFQAKGRKGSCEPLSVAIILSGCGVLDGSEISEAISAAIHVSHKDMVPKFYAPDVDAKAIVDHLTKQPDCKCPTRNVLSESARIARSCVKPLCECQACHHGGMLIPGGMGAARVLSNFADKGSKCSVLPDMQKLIEDFYCDKKPIGTMCIASAVIAKVIKGVKVTLGKESPKNEWPYADAICQVKEMGAKVEMKDVKGVTKDKKNLVFSTPAWLYECATYADVHTSIGKMVGMMKKCMN